MGNKKRFVATKSSLSFAETIAKALDIPFDKETTKKQARDLLDLYFKDISQALPNEVGNCHFENFASRDFVLFAHRGKRMPSINMDQQWLMFLMDANIIVCIRTCAVLDAEKRRQSALLFRENLATFSEPQSHETFREKLKPLVLEHVKLLPLANLLTMCMFGFMICHELAHHSLGHLDEDQDKQQELDADVKGFEYLRCVSEQFEKLKHLKVPPNMLSAPIVAMHYLQALESFGIILPAGNSHPSMTERIQSLREQFNMVADEGARYLYNGLHLSCEELMDAMSEGD